MKNRIIVVIQLLIPVLLFGQWNQYGQDLDGMSSGDEFGRDVCISKNGLTIAVGSAFSTNGYVKVYSDDGGVWNQIGNDLIGESSSDLFGDSISLSDDGNIIAIGATRGDGVITDSGSVSVYQNIGGTWIQRGNKIEGDFANDSFGYKVDLSNDGNVLAIGAPSNNNNGTNAGMVKVYQWISNSWVQLGNTLLGTDQNDRFGFSVRLNANGNIMAIGANQNGDGNGYVDIYEYLGGTWTLKGNRLVGAMFNDTYGNALDINDSGSVVAIAAPKFDDPSGNLGCVKAYEFLGGVWNQIGSDLNGSSSNDFFGTSVSLNSDGTILAASAPYPNISYVKVFQNIANSWVQIDSDILAENPSDLFGVRLHLDGNGASIIIGATGNDDNGVSSGHARVFKNSTLSIEDNNFQDEITMYPNPTFGISNIILDKNHEAIELRVYNSLGNIIHQQGYSNTKSIPVDTTAFASGVYLLKIISGKQHADIKLIKV